MWGRLWGGRKENKSIRLFGFHSRKANTDNNKPVTNTESLLALFELFPSFLQRSVTFVLYQVWEEFALLVLSEEEINFTLI